MDSQKPIETEGTRGNWFYGPPGTGKTYLARQYSLTHYNEEPFIMLAGKWMDGYSNQKVIIIEDLDKYTAHQVAHNIKLWADRYPAWAEVKGGTIPLMHEALIVTSNYTIDQAFGGDRDLQTTTQQHKSEVTVEAIKDRFI